MAGDDMAGGQEPTTGELSRLISRVEARVDEGLKELKAEFRQLAADWREQMAVGALTAQRVTQVDEKLAELADKVADLDRRLRVAETDHAAKQEAAERSRRASTWISVAVAVVGLVATVVFNVIKAGVT